MRQEIYYAVFSTAAGWCGVAGSAEGLRRTVLPQPDRAEAELLTTRGLVRVISAPERFADFVQRFSAYFEGKAVEFPDSLDFTGATPFQQQVWQAARRLTWGQTRSYAWLAGQIGRPGAARAVGQALGRNPLPVVVPCHRVLDAGGGLGGFTGGLAMKRFLLGLETTKNAVPVG